MMKYFFLTVLIFLFGYCTISGNTEYNAQKELFLLNIQGKYQTVHSSQTFFIGISGQVSDSSGAYIGHLYKVISLSQGIFIIDSSYYAARYEGNNLYFSPPFSNIRDITFNNLVLYAVRIY